jgi:hypothetical protein
MRKVSGRREKRLWRLIAADLAVRKACIPSRLKQHYLGLKFLDHPPYDGVERRQVNRRNIPKQPVIEPLVLVPQDVSNSDDRLPWCLTISSEKARRQRLRRFGNDLRRAFNSPAMNIAPDTARRTVP